MWRWACAGLMILCVVFTVASIVFMERTKGDP
jgi:hypothetical protein